MPKVMTSSKPALNELSYEVNFECDKGSVEVTNLFNNFKWLWSNRPKVIQTTSLNEPRYEID